MTFSAWVHWPFSATMVREARTTAAAQIIRSLLNGTVPPVKTVDDDIHSISKCFLGPRDVTDALLDKEYQQAPFWVEYEILQDRLTLAESLANFILRVSDRHPPSLNRARYFVAAGGLTSPVLKKEICKKTSSSVSKAVWGDYAVVTPFLIADRLFDSCLNKFAPDGEKTLKQTGEYLSHDKWIKFFALAAAVQAQLIQKLDKKNAVLVSIAKIPKLPLNSDTIALSALTPLSPAQIKIAKGYTVENAAKIRIR